MWVGWCVYTPLWGYLTYCSVVPFWFLQVAAAGTLVSEADQQLTVL
jgi:hypothetical protein